LSKFFINRPIFAIVISLIIVIIGVISAMQLPIAQYPQISPPTISVSASYLGASANVVNQTVAQIIEDQVNGTQGMDYMNSSSDDSGNYDLTVTFKLGTDGDMDSVKVQNNVAIANASLPTDVQTTGVTTKKASRDMALMISLYSPKGYYDATFIKNYADIYLVNKIKRVKGVGDVNMFGASFSMRVWLNPDKLAELGLTVADVQKAIEEQNVQAPAGTIGQLPAPRSQEKQYAGKVQGRLSTVDEFSNIIIKTGTNGAFVKLKDVAHIETGPQTNNIISQVDGSEGIAFGIQLTNDANAMETVNEVKKILQESSENFPPDLQYKEVMDSTDYISESIREVLKTFLEALFLVVLIVFIFLQSGRATLIPVLAIPVSLIGTFAAFTVLDFSINTLTLFAIVLAIGLVVDDAIVVIENVENHMQTDGLPPKEATIKAMQEVQGPIVAIACVLASVFIPVAFLSGMTGVLYKQFALTIAISMALSAFIALTLTPALCAMLLKPHTGKHKRGRMNHFFNWFNDSFDSLKERYSRGVHWMIGHARLAVITLVTICGLTAVLYNVLPSTFVPEEDQGYFMMALNLPEGTSLNRTSETVTAVSNDVQTVPGVNAVMNITGYDTMSSGLKSSAATFFVKLEPWADRKTTELGINSIMGKVASIGAANHPEASIMAINPPSIPGLGMLGGWTMQLQDSASHTDEELDTITKKIVSAANQRPELKAVRSTYQIDTPDYEFNVDREKAKTLGVSLSDVFSALQVNYGGKQVNDFNRFGRTYKVMLQSDTQYRDATDASKFVFVKSDSGAMVPLDTLVTSKLGTAPSIISRFNNARSIEIQGDAASGYSSGQAMTAMEDVVREVAPTGFEVAWSGQSREEKSAGNSTLKVLLLALAFAFLCLAALYESWSIPYAVLLTVPTGIFGALFSEYFLRMIDTLMGVQNAGLQNSVYMQIGVIMLIGLAAKNAILIVEFAKVRVDKGMEPVQAAVEAAKLRLRPILMTSFAFIIGCLPLAVATGAGAAARNSMGVAVVGGMLFATFLGIFLIPSFFVIVETISAKITVPKPKLPFGKHK
jgi:HAE1 family hydrophobic/amphiphilic exporter-1